jgi:hypothetical protein
MINIIIWIRDTGCYKKRLSLQLIDVVTTYLYESLDSDIYIKISDGISVPNVNV